MISFQNIFLLSFIQGGTEFLPISSSAHLILLPNFTNNPDSINGLSLIGKPQNRLAKVRKL